MDVQALAGDSVDNVPGVPGIGIKTAAQLIAEFGDLESLLARAGEIKQPKRRENLVAFAEQARVSRRLVELDRAMPLECPLDALAVPAQVMTGQALGAGQGWRAELVVARVLRIGLIVGLAVGGVVALLAPVLPRLFTGDDDVVRAALPVLLLLGLMQLSGSVAL